MKMKWFACLCALAIVPMVFTGCYKSVDGRSKAGIPWVNDKIVARYARTTSQVLEAARTVLAFNGQITSDDLVTQVVAGRIDNRNVWVQVEEVEPQITQVTVQARTKGGGSDRALAAEIDKQIALQLK